ncbi:predicted transcription regulator, YpuH-like family [Thermococcus kodakarensis KOD1]|uniref:Predicted transcription regulator, YpuH-like family n=1 Tax=Thermococcus kodakarensis (strain ATCC BAA-918 / JCM 12380 / KOD1) TaxID=69014 RepID=Q5JDN0_THEKO|nr:SMC-Scp complex subunit ScpB [Thermococcus kodakarensis]WCN27845.1 SMC-Scp complex subunit ScpB [Thermococcus kodakarensis]WCN30143.1 SMC-Scp complex subunit ScpB [Thermococcus kodakarensis]BAD86151.1 predicted transcription regulator, YpuH-like family [Thermococcus kodakarensis KOD1]
MGLLEDKALVEAALFVAGRPLSLKELSKALGIKSLEYLEKLIELIAAEYAERKSAIEVVRVLEDKYVMQVKQEYSQRVIHLMPKPDLRTGELKTLALIAYLQPVEQSKIIKLRGSQAYEHIKRLVEMGLVYAEPYERTKLLGTTKKFAELYGFPENDPVLIKEAFKKVVNAEYSDLMAKLEGKGEEKEEEAPSD